MKKLAGLYAKTNLKVLIKLIGKQKLFENDKLLIFIGWGTNRPASMIRDKTSPPIEKNSGLGHCVVE